MTKVSVKFPLYSTLTLSNYMSFSEGVSSDCATGFSIFCSTVELTLDKFLDKEYIGEGEH
jgi:hypothetical protein